MAKIVLQDRKIETRDYSINTLGGFVRAKANDKVYFIPFGSIHYLELENEELKIEFVGSVEESGENEEIRRQLEELEAEAKLASDQIKEA
jgi:hypothetical protein